MFVLTKVAITMFILLVLMIYISHGVYGTGRGMKKMDGNLQAALGVYVLLTLIMGFAATINYIWF